MDKSCKNHFKELSRIGLFSNHIKQQKTLWQRKVKWKWRKESYRIVCVYPIVPPCRNGIRRSSPRQSTHRWRQNRTRNWECDISRSPNFLSAHARPSRWRNRDETQLKRCVKRQKMMKRGERAFEQRNKLSKNQMRGMGADGNNLQIILLSRTVIVA